MTRQLIVLAGGASSLAAFCTLVGCDQKMSRAGGPGAITQQTARTPAGSVPETGRPRDDLSKEASDLSAAFQDPAYQRAIQQEEPSPSPARTDEPFLAPMAEPRKVSRGQQRKKIDVPVLNAPGPATANQAATVPDSGAAAPSAPSPVVTFRADRDLPELTPAQKREDAIRELVSQAGTGSDGRTAPLKTAMPLLAIDALSPGAAANHLETVYRAVSPEQARSVHAARDLFRAFATDPNLASGNPAAMARTLRDKADALAPQGEAVLDLKTVALCQRVDGFGRFTPLAGTTFLAGRPAAMIVYSEVENFGQARNESGPDGEGLWRVELGQSVRLYLDSDGSQQMVVPESVVKDGAASKRRDFFLVQRVDLPGTLSVGDYKLKVAVRDVTPPGGMVERTIPIRVVADPSAAVDSALRPVSRDRRGNGVVTTTK